MTRDTAEVHAARRFAQQASSALQQSPSFQKLDSNARATLLRDLGTIQHALSQGDDPYAAAQQRYDQPRSRTNAPRRGTPVSKAQSDPYALALETPNDLMRLRQRGSAQTNNEPAQDQPADENTPTSNGTPGPRAAATETLASRAGALSDEIDFPGFVAGLIHGTFDAMVDAAIRQMEAFAELVSAVAKDVDRFTSENVSNNQVRDWLVQQYPRDLVLDFPPDGEPRVRARQQTGEDDEPVSPVWLADYGLEGEELTDELVEETIIPLARRRVGENRLQTLATMVLLGMNRIVVKDGTISAKVRFRAAARDKAAVDLAISQDPGGGSNWGSRGSAAQGKSSMMVSTVGVNVQAESELKAELFGEVKINFASETLPLDRFVDSAQMTLLQRHARPPSNSAPANANANPPQLESGSPAVTNPPAPPVTPAPVTPPATQPPAGGGG